MKIEKLHDRQIRCTLTREDLESRQIKLSELAYGSEKTKGLFREMMQQAFDDFGFEAADIPLMIEAIPLPSETIVLIISKADSPDELDTRFSNFTHSRAAAEEALHAQEITTEHTEPTEWDTAISRLKDRQNTCAQKDMPQSAHMQNEKAQKVRLFTFEHLDTVCELAKSLDFFYGGSNSIYKDTAKGRYYLILRQGGHSAEDFNRIGNKVSEYLTPARLMPGSEAFLKEHLTPVILDNALQVLAKI